VARAPEGAVKAAKKQWRLEAELPVFEPGENARGVTGEYRQRAVEQNDRAISRVLAAALPAIEADLLERLKERVKADLVGESADLAGPLGEAIAEESGNYSLEFCEPETVAAGFCNWLAALQNRTDIEEGTDGC
jgi:hypothetical protein